MTAVEFILARKSAADDRAKLLREMHARRAEWLRARGIAPEPVESFLFCRNTRFYWPTDRLVVLKNHPEKIYVVTGYSSDSDHVYITGPDGAESCADAWHLEDAKVPQDILNILKRQMAGKCPLKETACLS